MQRMGPMGLQDGGEWDANVIAPTTTIYEYTECVSPSLVLDSLTSLYSLRRCARMYGEDLALAPAVEPFVIYVCVFGESVHYVSMYIFEKR